MLTFKIILTLMIITYYCNIIIDNTPCDASWKKGFMFLFSFAACELSLAWVWEQELELILGG